MNVVDASVWVSYYNAADVNNAASATWFKQQLNSQTPLVIPTLALLEIGGAIARRIGQTQARNIISNLSSLSYLIIIEVDDTLGRQAATLAIDLRLRGADAVYVAVAQYFNLPLITWDAEINNRSKSLIQVNTP